MPEIPVDDTNTIIFSYADYDKVGNRLSCKIDDANTQVYSYDNLYQLITADYNDGNTTNYYYDSLGNWTTVINGGTTNYTRNNLNQYTSVGGTSCTYDENGNLTSDGSSTYTYDCENRLTLFTSPPRVFKYDFMGRCISLTKGPGGAGGTTKYCYDGDQVIAEYDEDGVLLRKFIYGPGIDEPVCMISVDGETETKYYYHFDGLGSVVALTDTNRNVVESYGYEAFGTPSIRDVNGTKVTESAIGNPYAFTARRYDAGTGLYYYRARYYDPYNGRFLQTDPILSLNLYTYCGNNPINWVDPFGLWKVRSRPLDNWFLRKLANIFYGKGDEKGEHWHIFYDDESNSGYFGDGRDDSGPVFKPDRNENLSRYKNDVVKGDTDDGLMKQAEKNVQDKWREEYKQGRRRYNHPYNDCHTYVNNVLNEYLKLKIAQEQQKEKECKQTSTTANKK